MPLFFSTLLLILATIDACVAIDVCARTVTEFMLPEAEQTHEIHYIPHKYMLLITQFSTSELVKARTDMKTGKILAITSHLIGNSNSGLHGLTTSQSYPEKFWISLEYGNKLILIDPIVADVNKAPNIIKIIEVPSPGTGPHHIAEYGDDMWATLKGSLQVLRINHKDPKDYQLFVSRELPIFLAQHPISKDIYASEFKSNTILRITPSNNSTGRIVVPPEIGESPIGIVADGNNVWVTLLSIQSKGTGSFGKIHANGTVQWFRLKSPVGKKAALLHMAFDLDDEAEPKPGFWLLGSSAEDPEGSDIIIRAHFDDKFDKLLGEDIVFLPTQRVKAHRLSVSRVGVYATELMSARVAFYGRNKTANCDFDFQTKTVSRGEEL